MKPVLSKVLLVALAATSLAGCAATRAHKGAVIDSQLASSIQAGVDNKASVEKLLGRPTFTGDFTPNDWYYVARDTRRIAFQNPRVSDQTTLHIRFDQAGNVVSVQRTGKELAMSVDPTGRRTATLGRKRTFFEELFGNIGTVGSGLPGGAQTQPGQ
jgi:outer membrane protein assembly factor BamE (lipoprotein component of BamABCDE complex)